MQWLARHRMGMVGFTVMVAYIPFLLSPAAAPRWAAIAVMVALLCPIDPWALRPAAVFVLAWTAALGVVSLLASPDRLGGVFSLMQLGILGAVMVAAAGLDSLDDLMAGVGWGLAVSAAVGLAQLSGVPMSIVEHTSVPSGLFLNSEVFAEVAAMVFAWALLRPRWMLAALSLAVVVASHSRVGGLICAVAMLYALAGRSKPLAVIAALLMVLLAAASLVAFGPSKIASAEHRLVLWVATALAVTPFGQGLGWFEAAHPRMIFAHSDVLQALAELGWGALVPIVALPLMAFMGKGGNRAERSLFLAACVGAAISFPLHLPASGFLAAAAAGILLSVRRVVRVGESDRRTDDEFDYRQPAYVAGGSLIERARRAGAVSLRSTNSGNASHRLRAIGGR